MSFGNPHRLDSFNVKIAYFTGGTAGAGHVVRGLAVHRGLTRAGFSGEMRMFLPVQTFPALQKALEDIPCTVQPINIAEVLDPDIAPTTGLCRALQAFAPDLLIVDLFWAPLLHIRPLLQCEAWLIVRSCPAIWLRGTQKMRFDADQYARVIGIEPVQNDQLDEFIDPIVICNPDEARTRAEVCRQWRIDDSQHIVAVSHAGLTGEIAAIRPDPMLKGASGDTPSAFIDADLHQEDAIFPLAPWLCGVDEVHSFAGYNSYWESRWMGYDNITQFHVVTRKIEDPGLRLAHGRDFVMKQNGADTLARQIIF